MKPYRIHCSQCTRPRGHCYCEHIVSRDNDYPVVLLQSEMESKHPFNTGRIAQLSLSRCETKVIDQHEPLGDDLNDWLVDILPKSPVVAYPSEDAHILTEGSLPAGTPIIFLDDTWRKAKRFLFEHPTLDALPKVSFGVNLDSRYALRQAKKHKLAISKRDNGAVCTLESVVSCLGVLEGRPAYYQPLLKCLEQVVAQQAKFKRS